MHTNILNQPDFRPQARAHTEEDSFTYALVKSGPSVHSDEVENVTRTAIEVVVRWGQQILCTKHLEAPYSFTIGESSADNEVDFVLPREKLGQSSLALIGSEDGNPILSIPTCAGGSVTDDEGQEIDLDRARAARGGTHQDTVLWPLHLGAAAHLQLVDLSIEVKAVKAGKPSPRGLLASVDKVVLGYFGVSFLAGAAALLTLSVLVPPMGVTAGEGMDHDQMILIQQYLEASAQREEEEQEASDDSAVQDSQGGDGKQAEGDEGAMGKTSAPKTKNHYAVKGPPSNPDPHLAREQLLREAQDFGLIGLLNSEAVGDPNAPTAPWGRESSLGNDVASAMGNMWGDEIGESFGTGLGLVGAAEGGGGVWRGIGMGSVGTLGHGVGGLEQGFGRGGHLSRGGHKTKHPVMRVSTIQMSGRLPRQVIQRIVRQNHGRFRYCYEQALARNPNLEGRVSVRFVIGRDGAVSNVANGGSTLPDAATVNCVVRAYYGLSFPKPEGGIVTVVYPLTFSPG